MSKRKSARGRKAPGSVLSYLLKLLLTAALIVGAFFAWRYFDNQRYVNSFHVTVDHELKAIQELASYSYNYSDYTIRETTRSIAGVEMPGTKNSLIIVYNGCIKAGYSLDEVTYELDAENKRLTLTLPEIKVLDNYIDTDSIKTYEMNNIFNPISGEDLVDGLQEEKAAHLEEAKNEGLFDLAEKHAKETIATLFSAFNDYEVVFR